MNAVTILERQLDPLAPRLAQALAGQMPVERLIRTILISVERSPKLLECDRQSLFMAAMSAACLGLEVDGVTGQAFLIPFKNRAQLVIGYKGFNTLAARADITIAGDVIREDDEIDYEKGSSPFIRHRPALGSQARIIGAWATATHLRRPPIVEIMGIDDILAIKKRAPGAKMTDSPWNDPTIGFPAMASKTVKRRLARSIPLAVLQVAARLDHAVEIDGKAAWITPEAGLQVAGEGVAGAIEGRAEALPYEASETPTMEQLAASGPANVDLLLATARSKAKEKDGGEAFRKWYGGLTAQEQAAVDKIRKPAKGRKQTEDVI